MLIVIISSMFPRSTHETLAEKLYQTFKDNKRFSKPKLAPTDFTISHYAGDVRIHVVSAAEYYAKFSQICIKRKQ